MKQNLFVFTILSVIGAIVAWVGVGYVVWEVSAMQSDRANLISQVEQASTRQTNAARTHSVLQETVSERAQITSYSQIDILTVVNAIEAIGKLTGTSLRVQGAQPMTPINSRAGVPPLRPIHFAIQGSGTFPAMMRAIELLEQMPFPTDVTQVDISRNPVADETAATVEPWHANINVRLLTTLDVSS